MKLKLKNETMITIESDSTLSAMKVLCEDKTKMVEVWDSLTADNLSSVEILDDNDETIAVYDNLVLVSVAAVEEEKILATFKLRKKTELELLKEKTEEQAEQIEVLTACVLEMSEEVYA